MEPMAGSIARAVAPLSAQSLDSRVRDDLALINLRRSVLLSTLAVIFLAVFTGLELATRWTAPLALTVQDWASVAYMLGCVAIAILGNRGRAHGARWAHGIAVAFVTVSLTNNVFLILVGHTQVAPELYFIMVILATGGMLPLPPRVYAPVAGAFGVVAIATVLTAGSHIATPAISASLLAITTTVAILISSGNYHRWRMALRSRFIAEDAMHDREQLLRITAHDLRNPIGTIPDFVRLIRRRIPEETERELSEEFDILEMTARATRGMLDNLLLWAQTTSGDLEPRPAGFDLAEVVSSVADRMAAHLHLKSITLDVHGVESCTITNDVEFVRTILHNIVANAIKFTPEHETVTLHVRCGDDAALVDVCDNGIGMDLSQEPEQRSGTAGERGTGLGLPLVRELARRIHAELSVDSHPGGGTRVSIRIPSLA